MTAFAAELHFILLRCSKPMKGLPRLLLDGFYYTGEAYIEMKETSVDLITRAQDVTLNGNYSVRIEVLKATVELPSYGKSAALISQSRWDN
jgi:hypothetical protein